MPEKFTTINRLVSFIDPDKGDKFQSTSALDAIKLGGLRPRNGRRDSKRECSRSSADYIIAIISEEYGSIISTMIINFFVYIFQNN